MNPLNILNNVINPKQYVMNMISNNNPMFSNLIDMAEKGNYKGVETFARNFCKERNVNFDEQFAEFMKRK